jgi:hypothetical protein
MSEVVYTSRSHIERKRGPLRIAHLPGEPQSVAYSVHGASGGETQGIPCFHHRLRDLGDGRLNDGHLWRRAGSAPN